MLEINGVYWVTIALGYPEQAMVFEGPHETIPDHYVFYMYPWCETESGIMGVTGAKLEWMILEGLIRDYF